MKEITHTPTSRDYPMAHQDIEQKTILVVEDDRTHRTIMHKILKDCEFDVSLAENGVIALSKIQTGYHYDLIIMDWDMPELNGIETVKRLRSYEIENKLPHTPVIAFTSYRRPGDRETCLAAGMDAYLLKSTWTPRWRSMLIDNLQGLIASNFKYSDFNEKNDLHQLNTDEEYSIYNNRKIDNFDQVQFDQSASLLRDELPIAIDEYIEDAASYIREIRNGIKENSCEKTARGSHPLKSNSKGFGLLSVAYLAEEINVASRTGEMDEVKMLFPFLEQAFAAADKFLKASVSKKAM